MKVSELITRLSTMNPDAIVWMDEVGYEGEIVDSLREETNAVIVFGRLYDGDYGPNSNASSDDFYHPTSDLFDQYEKEME